MVLHASAVEVNNFAVAFAGETGRGKSTMAASLNTAGFPLLGDDALVVDIGESGATALPTYRSLRLWPASVGATVNETLKEAPARHYTDKRRLELRADGGITELPLAAVFVLGYPPKVKRQRVGVTRIRRRDACVELIRNSFQLDVNDHRRTELLLSIAADVAERVPVFELAYPREFDRLPEVHSAIMDAMDRLAGKAD
jgi:hypothetical protein